MTHVYRGQTSGTIYRQQLRDLVEKPDYVVTVRGRPTRELLNVVTEILDPRARCQVVPGRKLNPWLALSESLWLLAGRNDVASLEPYNKNIRRFSDNGEVLYGAYGYRISEQIPPLLKRLRSDNADRRGVLEIWGRGDLMAETKDPPCNTMVLFKVRQDTLHMTVVCRSNDLHWGLHAVNIFQFGVLQEYLASRLGVDVGIQRHISDSLHIYTDAEGQKITDRMLAGFDEPINELSADDFLFPVEWPMGNHEQFANLCGSALFSMKSSYDSFPFLEFADDFLRLYREEGPKRLRHADKYPGWVRMAEEFNSSKLPANV